MDLNNLISSGTGMILTYAPKIILVLVTLFVGLWVIKKVVSLIEKAMVNRNVDASLAPFIKSLIGALLKVLLFISVASMVGIATTSFVAILGAAGLAIGLALQGSLSNFAGGVLILIFKPFQVGDLIDAQGEFGEVIEIQIFNTIIVTPDNKRVILPNGLVSNGVIKNVSAEGNLRVDLTVGISYNDNIKKAKEVILETLLKDPKVLKNPAPTVAVIELGDNSVNLCVRPQALVADYWDVYFNSYENVKIALDEAGISIPLPQRDVHMITK